jgi:hypothetical protein
MSTKDRTAQIDFSVNRKNLYKEEAFTDMEGASIRRLTPIKADGTRDKKRALVFFGHTQLLLSHGAVPVHCFLKAKNLDQAFKQFPLAMKESVEKVIKDLEAVEERGDSRIIMPGQS